MAENRTDDDGSFQDESGSVTGTSEQELERRFDAQYTARVENDPVRKYVEKQMESEQQQSLDEGLNQAVEAIKKSDEVATLPDEFVRGYVYDYANRDETFAKAFDDRAKNPTAWQAKLTEATEAASASFKGVPDKKVTDDLAAAKASARTSSPNEATKDTGPTLEQKKAMSDVQWNQHLASRGAIVPTF